VFVNSVEALSKEKWLVHSQVADPDVEMALWQDRHPQSLGLYRSSRDLRFLQSSRQNGTDNPGHKGFSTPQMTSTTAAVLIQDALPFGKDWRPRRGLEVTVLSSSPSDEDFPRRACYICPRHESQELEWVVRSSAQANRKWRVCAAQRGAR
jgi:hypothetical protein